MKWISIIALKFNIGLLLILTNVFEYTHQILALLTGWVSHCLLQQQKFGNSSVLTHKTEALYTKKEKPRGNTAPPRLRNQLLLFHPYFLVHFLYFFHFFKKKKKNLGLRMAALSQASACKYSIFFKRRGAINQCLQYSHQDPVIAEDGQPCCSFFLYYITKGTGSSICALPEYVTDKSGRLREQVSQGTEETPDEL